MSGSPKLTSIYAGAERAQRAAADRARREQERRERERRAREAALTAARQRAVARIAQVRRRVETLRQELRAAAPELIPRLAQIEQALNGHEARVSQAAQPEAVARVFGPIDESERSAVALRATVVAKHQMVVANRLTQLIELVEEIPRAERESADAAGAATVDRLIAAAQRLTMADSVGPSTEVDRLSEAVRSHVDIVLAHRARREEERRAAEEHLVAISTRLAALREEATRAAVPLDDGNAAADLAVATAAYEVGQFDQVIAAAPHLRAGLAGLEAALDTTVDGVVARRDMFAAIVAALPGLGFEIDDSSVTESADGTIGLRAERADGERLAVLVQPGEAAPAEVLYATDSMEADVHDGVDRDACDPMIDIIDRIGDQLRAHGFEPGEIAWTDDGLRPPPSSRVRRPSGSSQAEPVRAPVASPWLARVAHELRRRRHVIIHGNVDDLVRWGDEYFPLAEVLPDFLTMNRFQIVGQFSLVDGLTYRDDETRVTAQRVIAAQGGAAPRPGGVAEPGSPPAGAPGPTAAPGSMGAPTGAAAPGTPAARMERSSRQVRDAVRNRRPAEQRTLAEALGAIRWLLIQEHTPTAVVLESADLLVGSVGQIDDQFPTHVAHVRRLLDEAAEPSAEPDLRNCLIFVARELSELPAWLRDNSNVAAVLAERPGQEERSDLMRRQVERFHGSADRPAEVLERSARTLTDLAEGMTARDIQAIEVTSRLTGIGVDEPNRLVARHRFGMRDDPWEKLDIDRVRSAEALLGRRVKGQPLAVRRMADALVNARVGVDFSAGDDDPNNRPKGVFFFVGPTGVGKTELAKATAQLVFGDENAMRRFDMSEFAQEHTSERLTGAPPGYVGHEQGGVLTNWVLERPFSVILFDEIEKAHEKIFDKFLQIIDDGRLTDGQGRTARFSHSIVIFTSNQGAASLLAAHAGSTPSYEDIYQHFQTEVSQFFTAQLRRPELLGRLGGGVVVFDILRADSIREITGKFLDQITASTRHRGYELVLDRDAIERLVVDYVMGQGAGLGARRIRDPLLEQWVRVPLNRWLIENSPPTGTRIAVRYTGGSPPFVIGSGSPPAIEPAPTATVQYV